MDGTCRQRARKRLAQVINARAFSSLYGKLGKRVLVDELDGSQANLGAKQPESMGEVFDAQWDVKQTQAVATDTGHIAASYCYCGRWDSARMRI